MSHSMQDMKITNNLKKALQAFFQDNSSAELVSTYLFFVQKQQHLQPVLFPKEKMIYQSAEDVIDALIAKEALWNETEIKVHYGDESVNENTKKIYICPFTGKVFGDNTHPNPQDAIYDWVSRSPENKERSGGLPVKRFYVSDDPEVIRGYLEKAPPQKVITKVVFSSAMSGKLFNSKDAVIADFKKNYLKPITLFEVQNQNRFEIEEHFLGFIQSILSEAHITRFVEVIAEFPEFRPIVETWLA